MCFWNFMQIQEKCKAECFYLECKRCGILRIEDWPGVSLLPHLFVLLVCYCGAMTVLLKNNTCAHQTNGKWCELPSVASAGVWCSCSPLGKRNESCSLSRIVLSICTTVPCKLKKTVSTSFMETFVTAHLCGRPRVCSRRTFLILHEAVCYRWGLKKKAKNAVGALGWATGRDVFLSFMEPGCWQL